MRKVLLLINCLVLAFLWSYVSWVTIVAAILIGLLGFLFNYLDGEPAFLFDAALIPLICAAITGHLGAPDAGLLFVAFWWFPSDWYPKEE